MRNMDPLFCDKAPEEIRTKCREFAEEFLESYKCPSEDSHRNPGEGLIGNKEELIEKLVSITDYWLFHKKDLIRYVERKDRIKILDKFGVKCTSLAEEISARKASILFDLEDYPVPKYTKQKYEEGGCEVSLIKNNQYRFENGAVKGAIDSLVQHLDDFGTVFNATAVEMRNESSRREYIIAAEWFIKRLANFNLECFGAYPNIPNSAKMDLIGGIQKDKFTKLLASMIRNNGYKFSENALLQRARDVIGELRKTNT